MAAFELDHSPPLAEFASGDYKPKPQSRKICDRTLARAIFFHRLGEIRDRTFENQRYRASGLNLAVAAIILWNTVYLGRAVDELRFRGETIPDELVAHIAPLGWEHIAFNGDYVWPVEPLQNTFRPLRNPRTEFLEAECVLWNIPR